jgi:hypothetical protein
LLICVGHDFARNLLKFTAAAGTNDLHSMGIEGVIMSARVSGSHTQRPSNGGFNAHRYAAFAELSAGERVCKPVARRNSKALMRGAFLSTIVLGGGWFLAGDQITFSGLRQTVIAAVSPFLDSRNSEPSEPIANAAMFVSEPVPERTVRDAPAIASDQSAHTRMPQQINDAVLTTAALPDNSGDDDASLSTPERLPPPEADPSDPYETRALSVGLHPGLSRALLTQLSAADYRNAGIAIRKALTETPDDGTFIWPRQRKPELALFRVQFVAGAAPTCRRYVVTVAKDGWSTTALPMEKCGAEITQARL